MNNDERKMGLPVGKTLEKLLEEYNRPLILTLTLDGDSARRRITVRRIGEHGTEVISAPSKEKDFWKRAKIITSYVHLTGKKLEVECDGKRSAFVIKETKFLPGRPNRVTCV